MRASFASVSRLSRIVLRREWRVPTFGTNRIRRAFALLIVRLIVVPSTDAHTIGIAVQLMARVRVVP